ncbi:hypothetical protein C8Q76DRAFT_801853 [Earliella scabrosa]|nr:hypothetical protein C8Q76DRAFT_801853 [Earliella scabrosa]
MDPLHIPQQHGPDNIAGRRILRAVAKFDPSVQDDPLKAHQDLSSSTPFESAFNALGELCDLVLVARDQVPFHAHRQRLLHASANAWGGMLSGAPHPRPIDVPEDSTTLSIALRIVYGLSCEQLAPSLEAIESALHALMKYGVALQPLAMPKLPLYQLIYAHAPYRPIQTYALAAHFKLEPLAVAASAHLLAFDTSTISDELAIQMGPIYLKRLFRLHEVRRAALKTIVLKPPTMHPPTLLCASEGQGILTAGWAFAAAEIAWDPVPHMSTFGIRAAFEKAGVGVECEECRARLERRIEEAMREWSAVQATI